jgi:hypothetical protein
MHPVADTLDEQERALLRVAQTVQRVQSFNWVRFLVGWAALFHATIAVVMLVFPIEQLLNRATEPAFELAGPIVWAFLFLGGAVSLAALWAGPSDWFGWIVLVGVLLVGGAWLTTFTLAVVRDESSPIPVVLWFFLYVPFLLGIGSRASGKR